VYNRLSIDLSPNISMSDVTRILSQIKSGDPAAAEQLLPLVYDELRRLAAVQMAREKHGHTLDATGLVHEAYVRLVDQKTPQEFVGRQHFFGAAAEAMRRILIENARRKQTHKRGGGQDRVPLDDFAASEPDDELLALDEALVRLSSQDPLKARLVELRYFAGLTLDEAAQVLGISPTTADRHWAYARAWLRAEVGSGDNSD
jgi:RNA polymerase sigma factor (TIGR02999 family)